MKKKPPKGFQMKMTDEEAEMMDQEMMWMAITNLNREAASKEAKKDVTQDEIRRAEMEKRTKENEERIIQRLMTEQGLTREEAEAKLNWPL